MVPLQHVQIFARSFPLEKGTVLAVKKYVILRAIIVFLFHRLVICSLSEAPPWGICTRKLAQPWGICHNSEIKRQIPTNARGDGRTWNWSSHYLWAKMSIDCLWVEVMWATSVDQLLESDPSGSYCKHLTFQETRAFQFLKEKKTIGNDWHGRCLDTKCNYSLP